MSKFFDQCKVVNSKDKSEEWLELRRTGIGGSETSVILGYNPYQSAYELYQDKMGLVEHKFITNDAIEKGNRLEQPLVDVFASIYTEYQVVKTKDISLESLKYPFMRANLDGALCCPDGRKGVLEIKTTTIQNMKMLQEWKQDTVPIQYYCQVLHYLAVTGFDFAIIYALLDFPWKDDLGSQEIKLRIINREDVIDDINMIIEKEKEFWEEHILKQKPPKFMNEKFIE